MLDKPAGPTSHDLVARMRRVLGTRAVGHTGTLDPFATGLLVVVVGRATRLARFVEAAPKTYLATVRLGIVTDTDDLTGQVVEERVPAVWPSEADIKAALGALTGEQLQRPPKFSAKRIGGERSYRIARAGGEVDLAPVPVTVHRLELVTWHAPLLSIRAVVSAGTYIRAIGRDLGERLGTGGHLLSLRREAIGPHDVSNAIRPEAVARDTPLLDPAALLAHLPAVDVTADEVTALRHGRALPRTDAVGGPVRLLEGGRLIAVAEAEAGTWQPVVVLEAA